MGIRDFKKNMRRETGFNIIAGSGTNKKIKARCGKVTYDLAGYGIYIIYQQNLQPNFSLLIYCQLFLKISSESPIG
jgi:hypothetical protein